MKFIKILFISCLFLCLESCSHNLKKKMGLVDNAPNETKVIKNKPLEMPPHFELEKIEAISKR
jgi:hypothetical protein